MKFSELYSRYNSMGEPAYTLKVDGTKLEVGQDVRVLQVECELTCKRQAGCLSLRAELDPDGEQGSAWLSAFQAGAACSLSLGYGSDQTEVFCGFLYEVDWDDPLGSGVMGLEAVFLDVRGRLMLSSRADAGVERTVGKMVGAILRQSCCTEMAPSSTVNDMPEDWDLPAQRFGGTDFDVVCAAAEFVCYEFYAFAGELYFGKPRPQSSPAVTFDGPNGLISLRRRRTLAGQCAAVAVSGADDTGARIYSRHPRERDSGYGTDKMGGVLSNDIHQPEPAVYTMAQAQYLSQARMGERERQAGGLAGRCVGLPEIRPGRFIKAEKMSDPVNGSYYVHTVRHILDETGFETYFEAEE